MNDLYIHVLKTSLHKYFSQVPVIDKLVVQQTVYKVLFSGKCHRTFHSHFSPLNEALMSLRHLWPALSSDLRIVRSSGSCIVPTCLDLCAASLPHSIPLEVLLC